MELIPNVKIFSLFIKISMHFKAITKHFLHTLFGKHCRTQSTKLTENEQVGALVKPDDFPLHDADCVLHHLLHHVAFHHGTGLEIVVVVQQVVAQLRHVCVCVAGNKDDMNSKLSS